MNISCLFAFKLAVGALFLPIISPPPYNVVWRPVPGTKITTELEPIPDFWYVGANTITRKGDFISFDLNGAGEYVRYSANCRTGMMTRILHGYVENGRIVEIIKFQEDYFRANYFQQLALNNACYQN